MVLPVRAGHCPRGFSRLQVAILGVLKTHQQIIAYWQIAALVSSAYGLTATEGAVRGALERLYRRGGFLMRSRAGSGGLKGNRYAFTAEPCPGIRPCAEAQPAMHSGTDIDTQSAKIAHPSFKEKIDRKNLSFSSSGDDRTRLEALTENDMDFHWPKLAASGFGTHQMRQIVQRLEQKGEGFSLVMQGLDHAEWALLHRQMLDKEGREIEQPVNWVFTILAKQAYYPRPSGFVSAQEQAELDAAEEIKRLKIAREKRWALEYAAWKKALSAEERAAIVSPPGSRVRLPEDIALRQYFRANVWPRPQQGG